MKFYRVQLRSARAFTMIEIAVCLAIIGFALVAIILALPFGLNAQRDNRQETVIGQDAAALIELIRSGARGADDLTNHVYAIINTSTNNPYGQPVGYLNLPLAGQVYPSLAVFEANFSGVNSWLPVLTNGAAIIGLLSTPELEYNYHATNIYSGSYSNHIIAYVRSMSGLAANQSPQNNPTMVADTFAYRLYVANAAIGQNFNDPYSQNLSTALRELRLTFRWPVLPDGSYVNQGSSPLTFRASIAGTLGTNGVFAAPQAPLYFYQPQTFSATP